MTACSQSTPTVLPTRCLMLGTPPVQLSPSLMDLRCATVITLVRAVIWRIIAIVRARVITAIASEVSSIIRADGEVVMIIDRVTPSEVVVVVRCVIDWTIVEIEISVTVPWTPTIGRGVPLNHSNFRLPTICRYLNIFYINLFATFGNNMEFHPSIFDVSDCGDFNAFRTVFRT